MRARRMPFMPPALFLVFAFSAASAAETRRPYRHPCLLQAVPPSPRKSNNSVNDRDLRYLRFLNKGVSLKSSRSC
jgi:hypothetical protein